VGQTNQAHKFTQPSSAYSQSYYDI